MNAITIVTGANSPYFLMACLLMESAAIFASGCNFLILDFGLTELERDFLRSREVLVEMPRDVPGISSAAHPYFLKTAIENYLTGIPDRSPIVWMDSDIVIGCEMTAALDEVRRGMDSSQSVVAACRESKIEDVFRLENLDFRPFAELLKLHGIAASSSYFNSGFAIFRSRAFLRDWFELGARTPLHGLFDQNIFNVLIHTKYKPTELPQEDWNLHGDGLAEKSLEMALRRGGLPKILHATSSHKDHVEVVSLFLDRFGRDYVLKLFHNPILRKHQFSLLLDFLGAEIPDFVATGGLVGKRANLRFPRNSPCPCNSGRKFKSCHGAYG